MTDAEIEAIRARITGAANGYGYITAPNDVAALLAYVDEAKKDVAEMRATVAELKRAIACGPQDSRAAKGDRSTLSLIDDLREMAGHGKGFPAYRHEMLLEAADRLEALHNSYLAECEHERESIALREQLQKALHVADIVADAAIRIAQKGQP